MNQLMLAFIALFIFCGRNDHQAPETQIVTCYGHTPCSACSSCNYCKYCNSGGSCGICAGQPGQKDTTAKPSKTEKPVQAVQCKATTKKGTRCSRNARSNGYCWQHGG